MRTLGLLFLSALVPATALAWDSVAEDVAFHAENKVFNGTELTLNLFTVPLLDVDVGISLDVNSKLTIDMNADSEVSWPTALTQRWQGVTHGGSALLEATAMVGIYIADPDGGFNFTLPASSVNFESGAQKFDTIPLPGNQNLVTVNIPRDDDIAEVSYTFYDALDAVGLYDVDITLGVSLNPAAGVQISGTKVVTNEVPIEEANTTSLLDLPTAHNGKLEAESVWEGVASGTFDFAIVGTIGIDWDGDGFDNFSFPINLYTIPFAADEVKIKSDPAEFEHALPAISVRSQLDMGTVTVGETAEVEIPITNLGAIDLEGEALYEGDAAIRIIHDNDYYVDPNGAETITLVFEPEADGNFAGTLTFESNDPMMPAVEVPVFGSGVAPTVDPGDDNVGDGEGDLQTRGCGCNSTPAGAPTGLFGLAFLGLLLRRRRS